MTSLLMLKIVQVCLGQLLDLIRQGKHLWNLGFAHKFNNMASYRYQITSLYQGVPTILVKMFGISGEENKIEVEPPSSWTVTWDQAQI